MFIYIAILMAALAFLATAITSLSFLYEKQILVHVSPSITASLLIIVTFFKADNHKILFFLVVLILLFLLLEKSYLASDNALFTELLSYSIAYLVIVITGKYQFGITQYFFGNILSSVTPLYRYVIAYSIFLFVFLLCFGRQAIYFKFKVIQKPHPHKKTTLLLYRLFDIGLYCFIFFSTALLVYYFGILLSMILLTVPIHVARAIGNTTYQVAVVCLFLEFVLLFLGYLIGQSIALPFSLICSTIFMIIYVALLLVR